MTTAASPFPVWAREIQTLVPVCAHFVLSGNVHDHYFAPWQPDDPASTSLMRLPMVVAKALSARGIRLVASYDVTAGLDVLARPERDDDVERLLESLRGPRSGGGSLNDLSALVAQVADAPEPIGLVIESASRLVRDPTNLTDEEFVAFRAIDRACRSARRRPAAGGQRMHSPVIWVTDTERDLPSWFTVRNNLLRTVSVPLPDHDDRERLAANLMPLIARESGFEGPLGRPVRILAEQTAGFGLSAIEDIAWIAMDQRLDPDHIEDAARSYRVGVTENPWRADFIARRLRDELREDSSPSDGRARLRDRVLGQQHAVQKTLDILSRSVAGLTAAHAGPSAARPRGVLFFAGPTGVGKTELAKAVTKLLFDDERFYIRFDMSEFSSEHSADRLIGAPPGYVGHDAGGELTNAISERPFSVVLFDEVEKAHERILDKFLQVLDDGRLTDGRGQTVFFTEAVIIFTSNLGIYREVKDPATGAIRRELAVSPATHPTAEERAEAIKQAIRNHFTLELGRPELLNRIGEDNIVVFDFIDEPTAERILAGMLENVSARLEREHGVPLVLTPEAQSRLRAACLGDGVLAMGGRGIGSKLETVLVNPLSRLLTMSGVPVSGTPLLSLHEEDGTWVARWS